MRWWNFTSEHDSALHVVVLSFDENGLLMSRLPLRSYHLCLTHLHLLFKM